LNQKEFETLVEELNKKRERILSARSIEIANDRNAAKSLDFSNGEAVSFDHNDIAGKVQESSLNDVAIDVLVQE
jgi:hypothetical protein